MKQARTRFLFASFHPHLPDEGGGSFRSIDSLMRHVLARGHDVEAVVGSRRRLRDRLARRLRGTAALVGGSAATDVVNGYSFHRCESTGAVLQEVERRLRMRRHDVVVSQLNGDVEIAELASALGARAIVMVRAPLTEMLGARPDEGRVRALSRLKRQIPERVLLVSNSNFIAASIQAALGCVSPVMYPIVDVQNYLCAEWKPREILFINPVWQKGLTVALAIARALPRRRFVFLESWPLDFRTKLRLRRTLWALGNVRFVSLQRDMRHIYETASLLIVPSRWPEPFGRVVVEAQANGIPVIASAVGGLPEALGDGGVLMSEHLGAEDWAREIERILAEPSLHAALSARARANACRADFTAAAQGDRFLALSQALLGNASAPSA